MPFVRRPLALLLCCGFAGALCGPLAGSAWGQGMSPLSVDPTLLGLPPAQPKPKAPPAPPTVEPAPRATPIPVAAPQPAPARPLASDAAQPERVERAEAAESDAEKTAGKSVERTTASAPETAPEKPAAPAVVAKPAAKPVQAPVARSAAPAPSAPSASPAPAAAQPLPQRTLDASGGAAAVVPVVTPAAAPAAAVPAARPVTSSYPTPAQNAPRVAASGNGGLAPLRVDPALLGMPAAPAPAATQTQVARPATAPAGAPVAGGSTPAVAAATASAPAAAGAAPVPARSPMVARTSGREVRPPLEAPAEVLAREPAPAVVPSRAAALTVLPVPVAATVASTAASGTGTAAAAAPAAAQKSAQPAVAAASLGPLKVDPTLLGLPALAPAPLPPQIVNAVSDPQAEAEAMAPALPPRRRRDDAPAAPATQTAALPYVERDPGPALSLRRSRNTAAPKNGDPHPTFLTARRLYGVADREAVLEGDAEMRRGDTVLNADRLVYWQNDDEVEATGDVLYSQEGTLVSGPALTMKLGETTGVFDQAAYSIRQERKVPVWGVVGNTQAKGTAMTTGRGQSEKLEFLGENHIRLSNATYTTCAPGNNDWYAKAESLELDYDKEAGEGKNGTLYFKDVPIFYMPQVSFALNNQRKSGFLAPTFGTDSRSGAMLTAPYYWNIAPNMDLTVAPRLMTKRGLQLGGELRYLNYDYNGYVRGEYVPTDNVRNLDNRYAVNVWHSHNFGNGFTGLLNLNKVSDDFFYTDLSSRIGVSAQTLLPRQGVLNYYSTWWSATANINRYQTLQPDINNLVTVPYDVVPQLTLKARRPDYFGTDVALWGQYTAFNHPTKVTADRTVLYPQLSMPFTSPSFYVTPKVGLHVSRYTLGNQLPGTSAPDTYSRNVPIFSLDSGLTFERETSLFGSNFTQTLEPRLYYLYVPYRSHDTLYKQNLSFDTGLADFNFGQIFSENRYIGQDYIGDANQLTAAVSTRFINPETGREYVRAMLGQRYYFADQRVILPGEKPRQHKNTNWLAAVTGQVANKTYVDSAVEYDPFEGRTDRFALTGRYQPETGKVLNAGYRYTRDVLGNIDVSGQWPLGRGWYGVGRYNYSLKEKRVVENIGGLEFNGGCWVVRAVVHQYALTASTSSTAFFIQLELNDFSRIGSSPLDMLRRTIPGYGRINQPVADPAFGGIE